MAVNVIVVAVTLMMGGFVAVWLVCPRCRPWFEAPKRHRWAGTNHPEPRGSLCARSTNRSWRTFRRERHPWLRAERFRKVEPGAMRELHWHATAAEWAFVVEGRVRTTVIDPQGNAETNDFDPGTVRSSRGHSDTMARSCLRCEAIVSGARRTRQSLPSGPGRVPRCRRRSA